MASALPLKAPTFVIYPEQNIAEAAADRLGKLQAELAPLKNEEEALKSLLRESGLDVVEGREYRATISLGKASTVIDWEAALRSICSEERLAKLVDQFASTRQPGAPRVSVKARRGI